MIDLETGTEQSACSRYAGAQKGFSEETVRWPEAEGGNRRSYCDGAEVYRA